MSSPLTCGGRGAFKAFTLIELLTVIAIIGILAGITFGIAKGVQEKSAISNARTELATIATALDAYKRQYGDYPQTGAATQAAPDPTTAITTAAAQAKFFNALAGKLGPRMTAMNGKIFLTLAQHSLETTNLPDSTNDTEVANALLDPWGRRYYYYYKDHTAVNNWSQPSYILFSGGPDGVSGVTVNAGTGVENTTAADKAADNIYANR